MSGASLPPATPPPQPAQTAPQGRAPVPVAEVTVQSLPPKLASLNRTVTVTGQVVSQRDGTATIRTQAGDVVVNTPTPLPTDRTVQLQIFGGQTQRAVALAPPASQGTPPQGAPQGTPSASSGQASQPTAPPVAPSVPTNPQAPAPQTSPAPAAATSGPPTTSTPGASPADGAPDPDGPPLPLLRPNLSVRATVLALPPVVMPAPGTDATAEPARLSVPQPAASQPGVFQPGGSMPDGRAGPALPGALPSTGAAAPPQAAPDATGPGPTGSEAAGRTGGPSPPRSAAPLPTVTPVPGSATTPSAATPSAAMPSLPSAGPQRSAPDAPASTPGPSGGPAPQPPMPEAVAAGGPARTTVAVPSGATSPQRPPTMTAFPSEPSAAVPQPAPPSAPRPAEEGPAVPRVGGGAVPSAGPEDEALVRMPLASRAAKPGGDGAAMLPGGGPAMSGSRPVTGPVGPSLDARIVAQSTAGRATPAVADPPSTFGTAPVPSAEPGVPQQWQAPAIRLAPGQSFQVRLLPQAVPTGGGPAESTVPPSAPALSDQSPIAESETPAGLARQHVLSGTVAGTTASGQTLVGTPAGTLVLQARTSLPPGTPVRLALDPALPSSALAAAAIDILHGRDWPALKEVMTLLAATDPALARQIAHAAIPQANRRLTTNLVFLLSAIRGGDARGWLGDAAVSALEEAGRGSLLARLSEDMRAMSRQAAEPLPDGWTVFPLPFGEPDRPERLQLYLRHGGDRDGDGRDGGRKDTRRFVIDVEFTRLGAMQLDGLVWPGHLDLILRTRDLLPADLKSEIGTIFRDSLEAVGFAGTLGFQTGAHAWVVVRRGGGRVSA